MEVLSPDSYWRRPGTDQSPSSFPSLEGDNHVDVAVVGAGITGLTAAMHLKQAGKRVAVVEAGRVGAGATGGTSGHLEVMPDQGWVALVRDFGQDAEYFEPADGLPLIGRVPMTKHLYLATGFSGTGLTYGTAAGKIVAELILTGSSPDAEVFSPARVKPRAAAKDFVRENLNAALHFVGDRLGGERVDSLESIQVGEGRVVTFGGEKHAAYRDEQSRLHLLSPVCTHAGCYVQWNHAERTWDCPCHGGRFSSLGERMYGPPATDLRRMEMPQGVERRVESGVPVPHKSQ